MFLASLHQNFLWMFTACEAKAGADLGLVAGGATGEGWQGPEDLKGEGSGLYPSVSQGNLLREICPDKPASLDPSFPSQASFSQHDHHVSLSRVGLCKF